MITANWLRQQMPQNKINKKKIRDLVNTTLKSALEIATQGSYCLQIELSKEDMSFAEIDYFCKKMNALGFKVTPCLLTDKKIKYNISWSKE